MIMGAVVGFLILSFAVWGIGDIFRGFGRSTVAKIGSTEITVEQFRQIYNDRLQQIGRQVGRPVTPDQARAAGLDRQLLGQLMAETAIDERARQLGLGVSDQTVAKQIREEPAFRGADGQFDQVQFQQRLRANGYTESRFVAERRRTALRRQLVDSLGAVAVAPQTEVDALHRFQNEQRAIDYVVLDRAQAGEIPDPSAEQLAAFYETRKAQFRAPEYRKIVVLPLSTTETGRWIQVTDEDARRAYDDRRARYTTAGRRHLQQIIFPTLDEARAAAEKMAAGASFESMATERGLSANDIDLGLVAKSGALAPAVAEAAFSLPEGGVSGPVQSRVGTALVRVLKVEPERIRPFEEVAAELKAELARERTRAEINQRHDKIEDERAGGQTLTEIAQKLGTTATTVDAVDRAGRGPDGAPALGLPTETDVISPAFTTDIGVESDALRLPDGGYVWFEVAGVTPARERSLEEVKDQVAARWREEQIAERLKAKAAALLDKLKGGAQFADLAAEGLKIESATDLRRGGKSEKLSSAAMDAVFRTPKDAVETAEGETPAERLIFRVTDINVPPLDPASPERQRMAETLRNAISEDLLTQYVGQLEKELGATINQDALRRVSGGEQF